MKIVTKYEEIDKAQWAEFVKTHPSGNVFQTPEMYEVFAHTSHSEPLLLVALEGEQIVGVLLANILYNGNKLTRAITARAIITGGPIVKDGNPVIVKALITKYKEALPSYIVYSEIRPVYDLMAIRPQLEEAKLRFVGHYNLTLDVSQTIDALHENMHKERKRNIIQAEKAKLQFKEVTDDAEIKQIVELINRTYKRKGVPMSYADIFMQVKHIMQAYVHFFAAYTLEGKIIAGQVRLCYNDLVYAWFAGSDETFFKIRPNDFLMWNVICWSHEHGYRLFDFGGGGEPGVPYGVRDYKLKYGCEMYNYGRYQYLHRPLTYHSAELAYKLFHKLKGK
ncbi:MAG: GNAT family N-acetyltransferase [Paludibacteraceae bacterium]|nr:GNAT family N-acetyltransferase [Paludibacteraceae bacterium]